MSRGLTDPIEPSGDGVSSELEQVIRDLILGQNALHDRLVLLERSFDRLLADSKDASEGKAKRSPIWSKGL